MRTYLEFKRMRTPKGKKMPWWKVFHVGDKYVELGKVRWHGAWWQFVFEPLDGTFWSKGCMEEIAQFLEKVNDIQRNEWRRK